MADSQYIYNGSPASRIIRRQFEELHPKDQQVKQSKKLCIEKNWSCPIEECLPQEIRPRVELKKGCKARISDSGTEEEAWWNWSVELLKALDELSQLTVNNLGYARAVLTIEVHQRQENPKSTQRKIAEVLLGDAQRVVDETRKKAISENQGGQGGAMQKVEELDGMEYENNAYQAYDHGNVVEHQSGYHDPYSNPYSSEPQPYSRAPNGTGEGGHATPPGLFTPPGPGNTAHARELGLRAAELKAHAARLRADAARLEVEATQHELEAAQMSAQLGARPEVRK